MFKFSKKGYLMKRGKIFLARFAAAVDQTLDSF